MIIKLYQCNLSYVKGKLRLLPSKSVAVSIITITITISTTGVCKKALLRRRMHVIKSVFKAPNHGEDRSLGYWIAWSRLAEKGCFHRHRYAYARMTNTYMCATRKPAVGPSGEVTLRILSSSSGEPVVLYFLLFICIFLRTDKNICRMIGGARVFRGFWRLRFWTTILYYQ